MISFKQFITEARMAPLYHGTSIKNVKRIIKSNTMKTNQSLIVPKIRGDKAISFSRSKSYAKNLAIGAFVDVAVLEFDQQKLSQRYKIKPFNFWATEVSRLVSPTDDVHKVARHNWVDESEERIFTDITNANQCITTIWINKSDAGLIDDPRVRYF